MKVGLLLNKELENIPSTFKNSYKVERNIFFCKNREIEDSILLKKCQTIFKELNFKKSNTNHKDIFSASKEHFPKKMRTTVELPIINIPNLKLDNIYNKSQKENNFLRNNINTITSMGIVNKENGNKTFNDYRAKSNNKKNRRKKNKLTDKINRRYNMFEKTLNKLKKPIFAPKNDIF